MAGEHPVLHTMLDNAIQHLRRIFSMITYDPQISRMSTVISWFTFLALVEQKVPQALLLVAYYCVAIKRLRNMWWVEGKAEILRESDYRSPWTRVGSLDQVAY